MQVFFPVFCHIKRHPVKASHGRAHGLWMKKIYRRLVHDHTGNACAFPGAKHGPQISRILNSFHQKQMCRAPGKNILQIIGRSFYHSKHSLWGLCIRHSLHHRVTDDLIYRSIPGIFKRLCHIDLFQHFFWRLNDHARALCDKDIFLATKPRFFL